jgi:superkiller protein 3
LLFLSVLASGCVSRTITQDFGLPTPQRSTAKAPAVPGEAIRATLQQQIQGAFNPATDDSRFQTLQSRLKLNPADAAARLDLAGIYESYRLYDDAFAQYTEALKSSPSEPAAAGLGRTARAAARSVEAIPLLEAFLQASASAGTWNELGLLYHASGNFMAGESALREGLKLDAGSDRLHNNLGYNLLLQNKPELAESEFRRAMELNPKSATARNNLGAVLARRGDLQGALDQFQSVADAATAHNNLAVVLLEAGRYEESREQLVRALAIRQYFVPALANFKLVQERIRQQAASQKASPLPQSAQDEPLRMQAR